MNDNDEEFDLDSYIGFAQKPEEKAFNTAWNAMSEAMLQAMTAIHAGADDDGKLSVIASSLEQGMQALKQVESLLGLSFIPKCRPVESDENPGPNTDEMPF
ncbi:hypothetical protein [Brucella anthropi]|uniref:hypothetical protein n=1 Tax=Brucella anthropi TaxID=529 RepID=UPI00235EC34B|nr:hypothetical protein [Brucella anthropi]